MSTEVEVRQTNWQQDQTALRHIREQVFIQEQSVPEDLEWDAEDEDATHFLMMIDQEAIGTARLLTNGQIGRLAVLSPWRGRHLGASLMRAVISEAERRGLHPQRLAAQARTVYFYQRLGFRVISPPFMDAGIPHVDMIRP